MENNLKSLKIQNKIKNYGGMRMNLIDSSLNYNKYTDKNIISLNMSLIEKLNHHHYHYRY